MKLKSLRAVFFDVGGTLLQPHPSVGAVYARVGEGHGFIADAEDWEGAFRQAWKATKAIEGTSLTTAEKDWWQHLVFHALEALEIHAEAAAKRRFFEDLYDAFARADAWQLYPGAREVLHEVRNRGLHVGVISNWDARLRSLLKAQRLEEQFDSITVSCEVMAEKPAAEIFQAALRVSQTRPADALHVGDSYDEDVRGATAMGMHAILVDRKGDQPHDCPVISHLNGVLDLLG